MNIRHKILGPFVALTLAGLASQIACRGQVASINSITNNGAGNNRIGVLFAEPVFATSATNPANYTVHSLTGGILSVSNVVLQTNDQAVELTLGAPAGEYFAVGVSNVVTVTSNVVNDFLEGAISEFKSTAIGSPSPAASVFTAHLSTFDVTVGGAGIGGTNDQCQFIYQTYVGDFDVRANFTRLDSVAAQSQAGVMAREALAAGSRMVATYFTSPGGSNEVEVAMRTATNGVTTDSGFQIGSRAVATPLRYLRLTRVGNVFSAYHGTNDESWILSGVTTQAVSTTMLIGLVAASHTNGAATTASAQGLFVDGSRPGYGSVPTISASVSGTNLLVNWNRTPKEFAMQTSTNLTEWSWFMGTIHQTNSGQRSATIPISSPSSLFFRLGAVDRVFPHLSSIVVSPGSPILLSPGITNGLSGSNLLSSALCVTNSVRTNAFRGTDQPYTFNTGYGEFVTGDSDPGVDTVLQVRKSSLSVFCNDDYATSVYSQVLTTSFSGSTGGFSFIVAVKANKNPTGVVRVKVIPH